MITVDLTRFAHTPFGTFGRIRLPGFECYSLELPWRNNEPWVSCIPEGLYRMERGTHAAGGGYEDLELRDVPGRMFIEIHRGNVEEDLRGCIAPGRLLGCLAGRWAVLQSRLALNGLLAALRDEEKMKLMVRWQCP